MVLFGFLKNIVKSHLKSDTSLNTENYKFDTVDDIQNIPMPSYKSNNSIESPVNNIEYILHRKATEFKRQGNKELAIACLKKANEIFPHSNFVWAKKDYMRVVEFLKAFGQFEEARIEEQYILENYGKYFSESRMQNHYSDENAIDKFISSYKEIYYKDGSDLVSTELTARCTTCEECTKYRGRIFSVYGRDARFPKLPDKLRKMNIHEECGLRFTPFSMNFNSFSPTYDPGLTINDTKKIITYVNRPFVDDRKPEEKKIYEDNKRKLQKEIQDRKDYDWLREFLTDNAPKSFGGYRKMKNANSVNYQKLVKLASEQGYIIK